MAGQQRGPLACTSYSPCVREHHERFSKHELLGQGACKRVYRGFDEAEGIEVAWCEITANEGSAANEKERERVFGEIRLLSKLKHKNILALHDWWFDRPNNTLVFITELFMDGSLRSYRKRHRSVDTAVLKRWAWQILQGLVYLHGHNPPIIHRDLKSDNIFINGTSGVIKIGDLGFATFRAGFSTAMSVIGTPEFMAPELYEEQYTEKVDVYSFGMCLMELATMEYPYAECRNAAQIYRKVTSGIPPKGLDKVVDPELNAFVRLCIQPDPNQRPEARQLLKHPFFDAVRDCGRRACPGARSHPPGGRWPPLLYLFPQPAGPDHQRAPPPAPPSPP
ncbi:kinase-like domain-containing protein [Haematococcus lacustris]